MTLKIKFLLSIAYISGLSFYSKKIRVFVNLTKILAPGEYTPFSALFTVIFPVCGIVYEYNEHLMTIS